MASSNPQISFLCKSISSVHTFMNIILQGMLADKVSTFKMKLLMQKLVQFSKSNIIQVATGIADICPGPPIVHENEPRIITNNNILKDFSILCMYVSDMSTLTSNVWKDLLLATESECTPLKLSLHRLINHVEGYVIMTAESIISTIDALEFESAMKDYNNVPIPEEITNMSMRELENVWFNL